MVAMTVFGIDIRAFSEGKEPLLALLVGLLVSFFLVRLSTRMARAGAHWWPTRAVRLGGMHIHHMVFGIVGMVVVGILQNALEPRGWWEIVLAFLFGGGVALVLDEFALVLHVEDVYWTDRGRTSVDAIIVAVTFTVLLLLGLVPMGFSRTATAEVTGSGARWLAVAVLGVNIAPLVVSLLKGKLWLGVVGMFVPGVAWIAALRLAKPESPWARLRYRQHPAKLARALERELGWVRRKHRFVDLLAGAPSVVRRDKTQSTTLAVHGDHDHGGGRGGGAPSA